MEPIEIDLNKPIFVYYVKVSDMSIARARETMEQLWANLPTNVTFWLVPCQSDNKIECIYNGMVNHVKIKNLIDVLKDVEYGSDNYYNIFIRAYREIILGEILDN